MTASGVVKRVGASEGFTIVELLVAALAGLLVLGAAVALFTSAVRNQPRLDARNAEIQQARTMSDRVTRELRQGSNASYCFGAPQTCTTNQAQLMILTFVHHAVGGTCGAAPGAGPAIRCRVFYSCNTGGACTRTECPLSILQPGAGCGPTVTVVTGLSSNQVFTFTPRTPGEAYVGINLSFPAEDGNNAITLQDGVALRNPPLGSS